MEDLIDVIVDTIKAESDALSVRITALEGVKAVVPKDGQDGKDATEPDLVALAAKAAALIPLPKDGKDAAPIDLEQLKSQIRTEVEQEMTGRLAAMVAAEVAKSMASIERPKDGKDADPEVIRVAVVKAVAELPLPKDGLNGKDADPAVIAAEVAKAVAAIPCPRDGVDGEDGKSVQPSDVAEMLADLVSKAVDSLPKAVDGLNGKDGIGLAAAFVDRSGHLVVTLSNGTAQDVGVVVGKDADPEHVKALVSAAVAEIPRPKDGAPGRDGTLEQLKMSFDGERTVTFCFKNGDPIEGGEIAVPSIIYRDVYESGKSYEAGEAVTWAGSLWIAKEATTAKPGEASTASRAWRLAVKAGRDGKQGLIGPEGKKGMDGKPGEKC